MTRASPEPPIEDIAAAFEGLRREVSLTRSAVEGLTAARERVPDYSVTLGKMAETLAQNAAGIGRIEESPAVRLTPAAMSQEIIKASTSAREDDTRRLEAAHEALFRSIGRLDGIVERGQAADRQLRRLIWTALELRSRELRSGRYYPVRSPVARQKAGMCPSGWQRGLWEWRRRKPGDG